MKKRYISKQPDPTGIISYTDMENNTWKKLYERQEPYIQDKACSEYLDGLKILDGEEKF